MQDPGCACCREVCIKPRLAYKTPGMEKESRLAPAPRYLMHRAAPRSERPAHHQLVARAGFLGFQLELVMVASQLVVDRVELVEDRSEEHTSELQSLMRISYAVFCLQKKNISLAIHLTILIIS